MIDNTNIKKNIEEYINNIEKTYGVYVIYVTLSGSKLYGTDNESSDTDYKFLYIPSKESVLLKKDLSSINLGKQTNKKNTNVDIDIQGHSIYSFFGQLQKSETGSIDTLFSMFRDDTIIFQDKEIIDSIKDKYRIFLNSNMKSFIGYSLGQVSKFGIKGARYDELHTFVNEFCIKDNEDILESSFDNIKAFIKEKNFNYIKFVKAPSNRDKQEEAEYISVLGKLFMGTVTNKYFYDRIRKLENSFGHRTKNQSSVNVEIIKELELLKTLL